MFKKDISCIIFNHVHGYHRYTSALVVFFLVFVLCPISLYAKKVDTSKKKPEKRAAAVRKSESSGTLPKLNKAKKEESGTLDKKGARSPEKVREGKKKEQGTLYSYEKPQIEEESYSWLIIKTILVLGMLVGGFYYFFRFVTKKAGIQVLGKEVIQILSLVPVGQNKFLQVVEIAGRILVIGVTESNISLITAIEDKEEIDRIRLLSSKSTPPKSGGFQEYISKQLERVRGREKGVKKPDLPGAGEREVDKMDFLRKQKERLQNLNGVGNEE